MPIGITNNAIKSKNEAKWTMFTVCNSVDFNCLFGYLVCTVRIKTWTTEEPLKQRVDQC